MTRRGVYFFAKKLNFGLFLVDKRLPCEYNNKKIT